MANFSVDDIEILRKKSGITYEEAVNLLEYHNGSVARCLVDLEKNGKLKADAKRNGHKGAEAATGLKGLFSTLYRTRIKATYGNVSVLNVSALAVILTVVTAVHVAIVGLIACLVLGYRLSIEKNSPDFVDDSFDELVRKAKMNVRSTVDSFTHGVQTEETETPSSAGSNRPATGTTPVNVQFPDGGSVNVRAEQDGFHEADIH